MKIASVTILFLLCLPQVCVADAKLECSTWTGSNAGWPQIFAWALQKTKVLELEAESDPDQLPTARLKAERKKLGQLSRLLGRESRLTFYVQKERCRLDAYKKVFLHRLEMGEGKCWLASCDPKKKRATKIGAKYLDQTWSRFKSKVTLDSTTNDTPKRDFMGMECQEYPASGDLKGKLWVGEPANKSMPALREFIETSRVKFTGYAGSLLYHAVHETSGIPVLARVWGLKGPNMTTANSSGQMMVVSFWYCEEPDDFKDGFFDIPKEFQVRKIGIR